MILTLKPASDPGGHAQWTFPNGAADYTVLRTDDAFYALGGDNTGNMDLAVDNLPDLGGAIVNAVEIECKVRDDSGSAGGLFKMGVSDGGSNSLMSAQIDPDPTYGAARTAALATNALGQDWDQAKLNATFLRLRKDSSGATTSLNVDYAWLNADVTFSGGGFGFTMGLALPLIGAGLRLGEMAGLARTLRRRAGIRFVPEELREFWFALRRHRRTAYFLP